MSQWSNISTFALLRASTSLTQGVLYQARGTLWLCVTHQHAGDEVAAVRRHVPGCDGSVSLELLQHDSRHREGPRPVRWNIRDAGPLPLATTIQRARQHHSKYASMQFRGGLIDVTMSPE